MKPVRPWSVRAGALLLVAVVVFSPGLASGGSPPGGDRNDATARMLAPSAEPASMRSLLGASGADETDRALVRHPVPFLLVIAAAHLAAASLALASHASIRRLHTAAAGAPSSGPRAPPMLLFG